MKANENSYVISGRKPERFFRFFEDICRIPRGSGNEKAISDYLVAFAKERGLEYYQDSENNVLIRIAATEGYETVAPIMLQGHVDMVCEKNNDTVHDFMTDPITPYVDGKYLKARGTTLGADNGVAVAAMMVVLDGELDAHPECECLFTTSEETGLNGAYAFDYSLIKSKRMINMDSECDRVVIVGCAGGIRSDITFRHQPTELPEGFAPLRVYVTGLMGGHSGENINHGRSNANKLVGTILKAIAGETELVVSSINGGSKENAIPRECEAYIAVKDANVAESVLARISKEIKASLGKDDVGFTASVEHVAAAQSYLSSAASRAVVDFCSDVPNGVLRMSEHMEGFVEFSRNLGVITTVGNTIDFVLSSRSAIESQLDESVAELDEYTDKFNCVDGVNAAARHYSRYPGWEYAENSALRDSFVRIHEAEYGVKPEVKSIHAGLECGIISSRIPGMDIIAIGPDMKDIHSPCETLDLESCEKFFNILSLIIKEKC